jgi:hypothetical protein
MTLQTGWYSRRGFSGEGITIFVNPDGGTAGTYYLPGGSWYGLFNFGLNPSTGTFNFDIARQDVHNAGPAQVGTGTISLSGETAEVTTNINGTLDAGAFVLIMPSVGAPAPPWSGWTDSPGRLNPVLMDFQTIWGSPYLQVGPRVEIPIQKSVTLQESVFDVACIRCVAPPADAPQTFGSFNHNLDNGSCFMWWSTRPADLLEFDSVPGWAAADQIGWQLNTVPGNDRFRMEPGQEYYLNIAFIQGWQNGDWPGAVALLRAGNPVFLRDSQMQPAQEYTGTNTYWGASQFA